MHQNRHNEIRRDGVAFTISISQIKGFSFCHNSAKHLFLALEFLDAQINAKNWIAEYTESVFMKN